MNQRRIHDRPTLVGPSGGPPRQPGPGSTAAVSRRVVLKTGLGGALGGLVSVGLPHLAAADHQQADWRFCTKCRALWYNGGPDDGVCAKGGAHRAGNSLDYTLFFTG